RAAWRRWPRTVSTTRFRSDPRRSHPRDAFSSKRDAFSVKNDAFCPPCDASRDASCGQSPHHFHASRPFQPGVRVIPLLLSVALAGGVYLTFDGFARPRRQGPPSARAQAARDFLVRAGLREVTLRDFVLFSLLSGALAAILVQLTLGWLALSCLGGVVGLLGPYLYYVQRHDRRRSAIQDALVDAIEQLRDAIRTGLSVQEALAGLARTGPQVLRAEFGTLS